MFVLWERTNRRKRDEREKHSLAVCAREILAAVKSSFSVSILREFLSPPVSANFRCRSEGGDFPSRESVFRMPTALDWRGEAEGTVGERRVGGGEEESVVSQPRSSFVMAFSRRRRVLPGRLDVPRPGRRECVVVLVQALAAVIIGRS